MSQEILYQKSKSISGNAPESDQQGDSDEEPFLKNEELYAEYAAAKQNDCGSEAGKIQWRIAVANERLIWWFAKKLWRKWNPHSLTLQDLVHYGMFGFIHAIEKFKPEFNTKLSSYAGWWIRRYIESAIFENGPTIRIPEYKINQKAQIDAAVLELLERGIEPSLVNISDELNKKEQIRCEENLGRKQVVWTPDDVDEINRTTMQIISSMDNPIYDDGMEGLHGVIADNKDVSSPEAAVTQPSLRDGFRKILESSGLSDKQRIILELYFYGEARNKNEAAKLFGMPRQEFFAILDNFENEFPYIFKIANSQREEFLSIMKLANLSRRDRKFYERYFVGTPADLEQAAQDTGIKKEKARRLLTSLEETLPSVYQVAVSNPQHFESFLAFARLPDQHKTMIGVYFCGEDLTKQDVAVLCKMSRERVRQIVESFTKNFRGPLRRLFLRDFVSLQECCELFIKQQYARYASDIEFWFARNGLRSMTEILRLLFIERLPKKEVAQYSTCAQPGTISIRLKRTTAKLKKLPPEYAPFYCGGNTSLRPKEIFARQTWAFLAQHEQERFMRTLTEDEKTIFDSRLALNGEQKTLRGLTKLLGKKNTGDISIASDHILQNFFDFAGRLLRDRNVRNV